MTPQESDLPSELAAPARRALVGAGYLRLEQLTKVSETELKQLHGIGQMLSRSSAEPSVRKACRSPTGRPGKNKGDKVF